MKNRYLSALVTSCLSIIPIVVIIIVLSLCKIAPIGFNFVDMGGEGSNYILLLVGAVVMILGLALFSVGSTKGLQKVGEYMGSSLSRQTSIFIVVIFSFLLGALITCAEPSILIVADQVSIDKWLLIGSIAAGVGLFVVIGVIRIIMQKSLKIWYLTFYFIVFLIICLLQVDPKNHAFLPFIFDAGGITTGSATVPFILSLGAGVATVRGGKNARDNSFGLVGLASIGPILTMTILILASPTGFNPYKVADFANIPLWERFINTMLPSADFKSMGTILEVVMALAPIIVIFMVYELIFIKLPKGKIGQLLFGFLISFFGLVLFLTGTNAAMQPVGQLVGKSLAAQQDWLIIVIAFVLGLVTILCEPAVHVLTVQIENISDGQLKKGTVLLTLSIGVGVAICLSMIRTIYKFSIMYYMIPGYLLSCILMFFVPDIYTAIAFDSGGTASGPMSVSFIIPLFVGLYSVRNAQVVAEGDVVVDGILTQSTRYYSDVFGVVALIALTPILAIQILGLVTQAKNAQALRAMRLQVEDVRNSEIIHFN